MNQLENPISFDTQKTIDSREIVYVNLMELCQGCPVVGDLTIDGRSVSHTLRFGVPAVEHEGYLYVPALVKRFWKSGFKLAKINLENLALELVGEVKSVIFLDRVENGYVHFFEDVNRTKHCKYSLSS